MNKDPWYNVKEGGEKILWTKLWSWHLEGSLKKAAESHIIATLINCIWTM